MDEVDLEVSYGGKFYFDNNQIFYRRGHVHNFKNVDPELASCDVLKKMFQKGICGMKIKEIWYSLPGKTYDVGLTKVENDLMALEMMKHADKDGVVHIIIVQPQEITPTELRIQATKSGLLESRTTSEDGSVVAGEDFPRVGDVELMVIDGDEDQQLPDPDQAREKSSEGVPSGRKSTNTAAVHDQQQGGMESVLGGTDGNYSLIEDTIAEPPVDDYQMFYSATGSEECQPQFSRFNHLIDLNKEIEFVPGQIFPSNEVLRAALRQYALESGHDYYYLHNDTKRVSVYCMHKCDCPIKHGRKHCTCNTSRCKFQVCASRIAPDGTFQLKTFNAKHECEFQEKNTKLRSAWLADKWLENFRDDPNWPIPAFIEAVKRKYGVDILYNQAWKAKFRAMNKIRGDAREEYGRVWDYAETVRLKNPGSSTFVQVDTSLEKPLFRRMYVSLAACIKGFKEGCRLGLDGCHLRGNYTGQVFTAVSIDGNNNIFPIAFAVVEAEKKDTWEWFIGHLMDDIREVGPTFMSDRQKGLLDVLDKQVGPHKHRICVRHFYENFKQKWSGSALKDLVWAAAYSYTKTEFLSAMDKIKKIDVKAYEYLMKQAPNTWSRHAFEASTKSDMLTNNVCEVFNALILPARDKPVISLCEWIRRKLMTKFVNKRETMEKHEGAFTPYATKMIEESKILAGKQCQCIWSGGSTYEVFQRGVTHEVDIVNKKCDCFQWDLTGIPCVHAIRCIMKRGDGLESYVDPCYRKDTYMKAYGHNINVVPRPELYVESGKVRPEPPKRTIQPGRPKKHTRRKGPGEEIPSKRNRVSGIQAKCTNCHQLGHNKRTCKNNKSDPSKPPVKPRGRPRNPDTVVFGAEKRKYTKRVAPPTSAPPTNYVSDSATREYELIMDEDGIYDLTVNEGFNLAGIPSSEVGNNLEAGSTSQSDNNCAQGDISFSLVGENSIQVQVADNSAQIQSQTHLVNSSMSVHSKSSTTTHGARSSTQP